MGGGGISLNCYKVQLAQLAEQLAVQTVSLEHQVSVSRASWLTWFAAQYVDVMMLEFF